MTKEKKKEIVSVARLLKYTFKTNDPIKIADKLRYKIWYLKSDDKRALTAKTCKIGDREGILINDSFDYVSKQVLCAHELGHKVLKHKNDIRYKGYNGHDPDSIHYEHEANLFAVALLFDEKDFIEPFIEMTDYTLQYILDFNIKM